MPTSKANPQTNPQTNPQPSPQPNPQPSYASHPELSRGRLINENNHSDSLIYRSKYQHDRDRIIHARTFRRIKHKTQVFITNDGDHYRTRLTHSLEVAQIARTLARSMQVNEDLTEAIALAHDIGHPPFGHDGEDALNEKMKQFGGFNHNLQALRNVVLLESQYPSFTGLNLTYECLDGILKHNGPLKPKYHNDPIIKHLNQQTDFALNEFSCLEAQIAAVADDVAYNSHDIDDGIRSQLISLNDLKTIPHLKKIINSIIQQYPSCQDNIIVLELNRQQISQWLEGILATAHANLKNLAQHLNVNQNQLTPNHIRKHSHPIVDFAEHHKPHIKQLQQFLRSRVYEAVPERRQTAYKALTHLFDEYMTNPKAILSQWQNTWQEYTQEKCHDEASKARCVCDYIAGMSDSFALKEYQRIFGEQLL